jgi:hypothetical protein
MARNVSIADSKGATRGRCTKVECLQQRRTSVISFFFVIPVHRIALHCGLVVATFFRIFQNWWPLESSSAPCTAPTCFNAKIEAIQPMNDLLIIAASTYLLTCSFGMIFLVVSVKRSDLTPVSVVNEEEKE